MEQTPIIKRFMETEMDMNLLRERHQNSKMAFSSPYNRRVRKCKKKLLEYIHGYIKQYGYDSSVFIQISWIKHYLEKIDKLGYSPAERYEIYISYIQPNDHTDIKEPVCVFTFKIDEKCGVYITINTSGKGPIHVEVEVKTIDLDGTERIITKSYDFLNNIQSVQTVIGQYGPTDYVFINLEKIVDSKMTIAIDRMLSDWSYSYEEHYPEY